MDATMTSSAQRVAIADRGLAPIAYAGAIMALLFAAGAGGCDRTAPQGQRPPTTRTYVLGDTEYKVGLPDEIAKEDRTLTFYLKDGQAVKKTPQEVADEYLDAHRWGWNTALVFSQGDDYGEPSLPAPDFQGWWFQGGGYKAGYTLCVKAMATLRKTEDPATVRRAIDDAIDASKWQPGTPY